MALFGYTLDWKILATILSILVVFVFLLYRLFQYIGQSRKSLDRFLKKHFVEVLPHAAISDSMGGWIYCDFLALNQDGIHVIGYMDYPGILFGAEKIDQWTQVLGSKSFRFENPLHLNRMFMNEIARISSDVPLKGVLVFSDQGSFPRGKPEDVYLFREFRDKFTASDKRNIPDPLLREWNSLKEYMSKQ